MWWATRDDAGWRGALSRGDLSLEAFGRELSDVGGRSVSQRGVRTRASQHVGPLTFQASGERSILRDSSSALGGTLGRYTGRVQLRARQQWIAFSAEHAARSLLGTRILGPSDAIFLETRLASSFGTQLDGSYQRRLSDERLLDDQSVDVTLRQRLVLGHVLEIRARKYLLTSLEYLREPELLFSYHIPLAVPAGRSQAVAAVDAIVRELGGERGVAGVLLRLGDRTALTDASGRASFSDLAPGAYTLDGDVTAHGLVLTTDRPLPIEVRVEGGTQREIVLSVARQAQVLAHVLVARGDGSAADGDSGPAAAGPSGLVILLARGADTLRRLVNTEEGTRFTGLRPGRWMVLIDRSTVPRHHRVVGDSIELTLAAGESREASLALDPVVRPMVVVADRVLRADGGTGPLLGASRSLRDSGGRPRIALPPAPNDAARTTAPVSRANARSAPASRRARAPVTPQLASKESEPPHYYVVRVGERTLEDVARWVYGDAELWPKLWAANRAEPGLPDRLERGSLLRVPRAGPLTSEELSLSGKRPSACAWSARTETGESCP
jgi:nucleoid-associated protein YgaU